MFVPFNKQKLRYRYAIVLSAFSKEDNTYQTHTFPFSVISPCAALYKVNIMEICKTKCNVLVHDFQEKNIGTNGNKVNFWWNFASTSPIDAFQSDILNEYLFFLLFFFSSFSSSSFYNYCMNVIELSG